MWRQKWGLTPEPISTQVIPRDRHAMFFATLGVVASSMERAGDRGPPSPAHEVLEARVLLRRQKGSSSMPHKRNPVLSENITGLARMVRGYVTPALENGRAVARTRHLAFLGRAHDRAGRDRHARLRARAPRRLIDKLSSIRRT
jgi:adenylosuccinate lyase